MAIDWYRPHPMIVEDEDGLAMVLALSCRSIAQLTRACEHELRALIERRSEAGDFGGRVVFAVDPLGLDVDQADLARLESRLNEICEAAAAGRESPIRAVCRLEPL